MVTLRINYRFGGYGAPIAARYSTASIFPFFSPLALQLPFWDF